jgi:RNA polymerase sigma-70 factor (ECF subfamily)
VARNVMTDAWRAEQIRPREVHDERALDGHRVEHDIDRLVETWTVQSALSRLTPEHRSAVVEVHVRGRTVAEAAVRLGIPEGTVKSRTFHGLRALRKVLVEMGAAQ